jgi:hypothetical protein
MAKYLWIFIALTQLSFAEMKEMSYEQFRKSNPKSIVGQASLLQVWSGKIDYIDNKAHDPQVVIHDDVTNKLSAKWYPKGFATRTMEGSAMDEKSTELNELLKTASANNDWLGVIDSGGKLEFVVISKESMKDKPEFVRYNAYLKTNSDKIVEAHTAQSPDPKTR